MAADIQDLNFDEGDDFPYEITLTDSTNDPIDLTGYTFYMTIKKNQSDSDDKAILKKTVSTIPNPELGIVTITIDRDDTKNVQSGIYSYDIKYNTSLDKVKTILKGSWTLSKSTTDII